MSTMTPGNLLTDGGPVAQKLLEATGMSKKFGGVYALRDVDFDLQVGEVHALLGPNGAGKSTLIKLLNGVEVPDSGQVLVGGRMRERHDIATVFQELSLVPSLNVAQNIFLNDEIRRYGLTDSKRMERQALQVTERLGLRLQPTTSVCDLSVAERQLVEIAKAVHRHARVLVLDEPTATLTKADQILLFERIRDIQKAGVGIIYVTHRLSEVFELADRVTVIRDGSKVLTSAVTDLDMRRLVAAISGGEGVEGQARDAVDVAALGDVVAATADRGRRPALAVESLSGDRFNDVSLEVGSGEVVGIAGLIGTGRTELLETIAGVRRRSSGSTYLDGEVVSFRDPARALAAGIALVPEDRHGTGVVLQHSVLRNLTLAHQASLRRWGGWIDGPAARRLATRLIEALNIKVGSVATPVGALSGGNQQKVVFGKWLQEGTKVLLLDEPTQGVDVRARQEIYRLVREMADRGAAVLVVSSDFEELGELCSRVYFMTAGSMSAPLKVTSEVTDQFIYSRLNERLDPQ